jgi:hypothetical protein
MIWFYFNFFIANERSQINNNICFEETLIANVSKFEKIYNFRLATHKMKDKVAEHWVEITTIMKEAFPYMQIMKSFLNNKWTNVRDSWLKYHKTLKKTKSDRRLAAPKSTYIMIS